jgi:hypothetical protein
MNEIRTAPFNVVREINLCVIERLIRSGVTEDDRKLGAIYVLSALTLVSSGARNAMPWLYQSVVVVAPPSPVSPASPASPASQASQAYQSPENYHNIYNYYYAYADPGSPPTAAGVNYSINNLLQFAITGSVLNQNNPNH